MIKSGFYRMSNDSYHASEGVSKSTLHVLLTKSPAHSKVEPKVTDALYDGIAIHCAVFEPARFDKEYVQKPDGMKFTTTEGKGWRANAEKAGMKIIEYEKHKNFQAMAKAVRDHPEAALLLVDGEAEKSGYWIDPDCPEILCKLRADWIKNDGTFVDLKSTTDAREHAIVRDAYKNGWDMQSGQYLYGATQITRVEHHDFYFIAVEKEPPYGVMVYKATEEMINHGLTRIARAMAIYKECLESGKWPKYPQEVKELGLPGWVTRKEGYGGGRGALWVDPI